VYESPPARPHRIAGWIRSDSDPLVSVSIDDHLQALRKSAAEHGCEAVVWNPSHRLVDGLVTVDATGVWLSGYVRGGPFVIGARAACLLFSP
jgi:hypothetical protein